MFVFASQVLHQGNRRMLMQVAAIAIVGLVGMLALMPTLRAGSVTPRATMSPGLAMLLSPHRLETPAFVRDYLGGLR
jgi:hypothetical protein